MPQRFPDYHGPPPPTARLPMVDWYAPGVLLRTAAQVAIANLFGRHSDRRLLEALATQPQPALDFSATPGEFTFDYVSDVGDGFDSTYAIAHWLAQPKLVARDDTGRELATHGGRLLVFGGDCVYPGPSREAYATRTEAPYATAFAPRDDKPDVLAIPGNHDWYDSLIAFSRTFCRPDRAFAGCPSRQTRSYFAARLPQGWWIVGVDTQLGSDLDEPQLRYLRSVAAQMAASDRLILCVASAQWLLAEAYPDDPAYDERMLAQIEELFGRRASVVLTGDLHCYRRHASPDGRQRIVAGGGGAFLHPTHAPSADTLRDGAKAAASYPDAATSRRLAWRNLAFPWLNRSFGAAIAVLYFLTAWFVSATLTAGDVTSFSRALAATGAATIRDPLTGLWMLLVLAAFVFFTDTHVRWYRICGGIAHALSHLLAAFALAWLAVVVTVGWLELPFRSVPQLLMAAAITVAGGWWIGSFLMGTYLLGSLAIFGRHNTEAFSSLKIQDYKHWLRLTIAANGELAITALAVDRVPRRWREVRINGAATLVPDDPRATPPRVVDRVVLPATAPLRS